LNAADSLVYDEEFLKVKFRPQIKVREITYDHLTQTMKIQVEGSARMSYCKDVLFFVALSRFTSWCTGDIE
jgi:hypothetical protein